MRPLIDALAQTNRLRSLPPERKLGFGAALFLLGYLAPLHVQGLISLWLFRWVVQHAQIPARTYLKFLALPLGFLLLSLPPLVVGLGSTDTPARLDSDAVWGAPLGSVYCYLSRQGLEQARTVWVRSLALTSCLYFILLTVPMFEILRVLNRLGCPPLLTEIVGLTYRFIFILADTASELLTAQHSRLGYGSWRLSLRSLSLLAGRLLQRSLRDYQEFSLGLISRGYVGELRVWSQRRYHTPRRYTVEASAGYLLLLVLTAFHLLSASRPIP